MGLCASMLQRTAKNGRHPEARRGAAKALFVVRSDRRQDAKPQALMVQQPRNPGCGSGFREPGKAPAHSKTHEKCRCYNYGCCTADALGRMLRVPKWPGLPCGSAGSVAVEPIAPVLNDATTSGRERSAVEGCSSSRTPMTPRRTPVWQRRILMGTRCELPRFSGVILYDEHGRRVQSGAQQNRADHNSTPIRRARRSESKGNKKTAGTTTTLRDLL